MKKGDLVRIEDDYAIIVLIPHHTNYVKAMCNGVLGWFHVSVLEVINEKR